MMMRRARGLAGATLLLFVAHCALVFDPDALGPGSTPAGDGGGDDAPSSPDALSDGAVTDGGSTEGSDGRGPTGLDGRLPLPDLDAATCLSPTFVNANCGVGVACRMATPDSGRCESCTNACTLHAGELCTRSNDCDSNLECFRGRCTLSCTLGGYECGRIEYCLDVGYQGLGLCDPSTL